LPDMTIGSFGSDEHTILLNILSESLGQFVDMPGTRKLISSDAFDPEGCFLAREKGAVVGCIAVTSLPRKNWLVIRYLAAKHAMSRIDVVEKLLERALEYVETRRAEFLRATTPAIQPYVDVYKGFGFKPLRRDFRITWDLRDASHSLSKRVEINYYKKGEARFRGTYVLPEYRGKGYGRTLMNEVSDWAKTHGQHKMTVYTFSYLDSLAPGALLYLKSGGRIECEYLQMQRA